MKKPILMYSAIFFMALALFCLVFLVNANAQDPDDPLECDGVTYLEDDIYNLIGWCWKKNPPQDAVDHYTVWKSMVSGVVGTDEIYTLSQMDCKSYICETPVGTNIPEVGIHYFVIIAYDSVNHESGPSNETTLVVRPAIDIPPQPYDLKLTFPIS